MQYKKIQIDKYGCCLDKGCSFKYECAQHTTAGDFRTEGGFSPKLIQLNDTTGCNTFFSESDEHCIYQHLPKEDLAIGFQVLKDGKWTLEQNY